MNRLPTLRAVVVAVLLCGGLAAGGCTRSFHLSTLPHDERARIAEIVLAVAEAPQEVPPETRREVWAILRAHGQPSADNRRELAGILYRIGQGTRLFWLDAQQAVASGHPVKSDARTQWEADLLKEHWLSPIQQHRYDDLMEKISRQEPIESSHGVEISLNESMARAIVESWSDTELRSAIDQLLTPP